MKDILVGIGALIVPSLLPSLNSILQLFMPGASAAFFNFGNIRRSLLLLFAVYIGASLLFLAAGMAASLLILAQAVVICGVLLVSLWKEVEAPKTVIVMTLAILAMSLVVMGAASGWRFHDVYMKMVSSMTSEYDKAVELYKKNAGNQLPVQLDEIISQVKQTLISYFPGIVCSFFVFLGLSNTLVFVKMNQARQKTQNLAPEFHQWRMPWPLVWLFILFGFMALLPTTPWNLAGKNGVLVVSVFYLIQGFSIMQFFFKVMQTPVYVRYLVYALIGIQWYGLLLVVLTGLMDNWFDFRGRLEARMSSKGDDQE